MDLDHVYFSNLKKFDGKKLRRLNLAEIGQIAGRAGRHLNDGDFGITGECKDLNSDEIELLEKHKFEEIKTIFWRNSNLDFSSVKYLVKSLEEKPNRSWLRRINECEDEKVLKLIIKDDEPKKKINEINLKILWECCQIPDFVKKTYGHHLEIVKKVFEFLTNDKKKIPNQYMKMQLSTLDKLDGNVDSLSNRIANVRTWSYVSNKSNWVENQDIWIERTKYLEDKLSERLHEELTKSFIDKRASVLARGLKQDIVFETQIVENKKVMINDQYIGELKGLKLELDLKIGALDTDVKSLKKAARQNVSPEILKRIDQIITSNNIKLRNDFKIYWNEDPIAILKPGKDYLNPDIRIIIDDMIESSDQKKLYTHIDKWLLSKIKNDLNSLFVLKKLKNDNPQIRALSYLLYENNGVVKRENISSILKNLNQENRKILRDKGVKFGRYHIFLHKLFKPQSVSLRILLWKNYHQKYYNLKPPTFGLNFVDNKEVNDKDFMLLCGFEKFGEFFVRIDILERLFIHIIKINSEKKNKIKLTADMLNLLGCNKDNFLKLIKNMNYKSFEENNEIYFKYAPKKKIDMSKNKISDKNNPFNVLNQLNIK